MSANESNEEETDGFRYHQATINDIEQIVRFRRMMFCERHNGESALFDTIYNRTFSFYYEYLTRGDYQCWLVYNPHNELVATGAVILYDFQPHPLFQISKRPVITNMYTIPDYRRKGIARKIMVLLIKWCSSNGYNRIYLTPSEDGRPLYESLGFVPSGEMVLQR